jgi:hypothetical protein
LNVRNLEDDATAEIILFQDSSDDLIPADSGLSKSDKMQF